MMIAIAFASILLAGGSASQQSSRLACNLKAIGPSERPRYDELTGRLRSAVRDRRELAKGFAFRLDSKVITLPEVAEWVAIERLCCPFLVFDISISGDADFSLRLTGPKGVKQLLEAEFASR
jgi:hypothetical protein